MFRAIQISAVLNGWVVQVGCQTVVYQDRNQLVTDLDAYLKDPDATEQRFLKTGVNQLHTGGVGAVTQLGLAPTPLRAHDEHAAMERERHQYAQAAMETTAKMPRDRG